MNAVVHAFQGVLNTGLAFLYPEVCQVCGNQRATPAESFLCPKCRASVKPIRRPFCEMCGLPFQGAITNAFKCANCQNHHWAFSSARAAVIAKDAVLEIIHQYKYRHALWFEPFLAHLLIDCAVPELALGRWDYIVPIPLHPTKQREREFNQAERLARRLSRATGITVSMKLLRRTLPTKTQTLLTREERLANVSKAFTPVTGTRVEGKRIVLVDDVFTTGATTGSCARVLRSMGAAEICVWTVARGI
jgi:competence protein ComFC